MPKKMKTSNLFVLSIFLLVSFKSILSDKSVTKSGCYERNDQINIKCNSTSIFAYQEVTYGFPNESCTDWNLGGSCSSDGIDCFDNTKFWSFMKNNQTQKCSGNQVCTFQTVWQPNDHSRSQCQNASSESCFLSVKGQCLYEEKKVDFCEAKTISGSKIYIHNPKFPSFDKSNPDYECDCAVESMDKFKIDVIIFALNFSSIKNCSSSLQIHDGNNTQNFTCDSLIFNESINISDSRRINLKLTKRRPNVPYQIWLKIQSVENEQLTVKCKKENEFTSFQTTTGTPLREIVSKADQERMNDFMFGVKIASGVVAGIILLTLVIITIYTYRRYANIVTRKKTPSKSFGDNESLHHNSVN